MKGDTNRDLINYALELQAALASANADKKAVKSWVEGMKALEAD